MSTEWKKFLLQWILPVVVFGIVMVFLIASFDANIKAKASSDYENNLVESTEGYATGFCSSVQKSIAVANAAADVLDGKGFSDEESARILSTIVTYTDAYLAVMCEASGRAVSDSANMIEMNKVSYFSSLFGDNTYEYHFLNDDEILGNPSLVLSVNVGEGTKRKILVYYPMNVTLLKKIVTAESDYDAQACSMVLEQDGTIIVSSSVDKKYAVGNNIWDILSKNNNDSTVKRVKTKVGAGNSGVFAASIGNSNNYISYATIPEANKILMVSFTQFAVEKAENKLYTSSAQKLGWVIGVMVMFILVVTALNVIQIFTNSKDHEDLKDKADTDQLTGLKNKIATEREIKEYIQNNPDGLAMMFLIDIDNFKKINDTMGHAFGDEVLRELGRHIGINFRVSDIIGRTGGDEFTVFLKNLKEDGNTIKEAQKLAYFFKHFQVGDYVKYSVTASIGAAVFPAHGADFESLYKSADAAVYKSKKRGKNQLSFYDDRDRTPEEIAYADSHLINIERKEQTPID